MTINDLKRIFQSEGIHKDEVSFADPVLGEAAGCLRKRGETWIFYVEERGEKGDFKEFASENEACTFLLKDISNAYPRLKKYLAATG
jgi:hypothetical protein